MRVRPISPQRLVTELAQRLADTDPTRRLRVAVDGPSAARPEEIAAALVDPLRAWGRPARHLRSEDFLRPASVRLERGRTNPDSYYEGWVDEAGLRREVLDPAGPDGDGRILPSLWDPRTDRASRAEYVELPPNGIVLVSGAFLLGGGLPFEITVHLEMSAAALERRTPADLAWTLPAHARYAEEVAPATFADLVVRLEDPRRPAIVESVPDAV
ncbi:uridine kinase [Micromonospora sp. NPDC048871]|uniref:uridine kinase n=1 Tax=unclassified Micromonospora TaxID=2617518 RepID=UPI002E0DA836|nr:uridine kinase [Micromonospora sp. NBC_01739]